MGSKTVNMCAAGERCQGICPETRSLRTKSSCPAFYIKTFEKKKENPRYDDLDLMEE